MKREYLLSTLFPKHTCALVPLWPSIDSHKGTKAQRIIRWSLGI